MSTEDLLNVINHSQGALIAYSNNVNSWLLTFRLVSSWKSYNVVIVTDHPHEFALTLEAQNSAWKDAELIPYPLIKYSNLGEVNSALHNTEVDIVLFDNARMFSTIAPALDLQDIIPKIVILTTWGDDRSHIAMIMSLLPNMYLLSVKLNSQHELDWKFFESKDKIYDVTNGLLHHPEQKQIIFSRTHVRDIVESLRDKFSGKIFYIACGDNYKLNHQICSKFADSSDGVLVTSIIPSALLKEISTIHIVDNYYFPLVKLLIAKCHADKLQNICTYVTDHDKHACDHMYHDLLETNDVSHTLLNRGTPFTDI